MRIMDDEFYELYGSICTNEQFYRLSFNISIKSKLIRLSKIKLVYTAIIYILQHDYNWIISLNRFLENINDYNSLIKNVSEDKINNEIIQLFLELVLDNTNYFEINTYSDLINFHDKKNEVCLKILSAEFDDDIPSMFKEAKNEGQEENLYKFALLEYKFGISLYDAYNLVERYGKDVEELPEGTLKTYLQLLKQIVDCRKIKDIINFAKENNLLKETWDGFPNAREAEGKILDLFAQLYNQTLYKPNDEDKEEAEIYIDTEGKQYKIDVYKVKKDFTMCVRSEGAFCSLDSRFCDDEGNIIDYAKYYNREKIIFHGNSESFVANDNVALAKSEFITVGYEKIYHNQLAGGSPKVATPQSRNGIVTYRLGREFSIYGTPRIELRTPKSMIDNTRMAGINRTEEGSEIIINFNEIFKDRIIVNENDEVEFYKPSYVVWTEEDTEEERKDAKWKQNREKQKKWIQTKQAAAQLGVPIVIIDREYFAKREMQKTILMKEIITGEEIGENEYSEFIGDYQNLTKPEIIKRLFITIENNKTGMINTRFHDFFKNSYLEELRNAIFGAIDKMDEEEARKCVCALMEVSKREKHLDRNAYNRSQGFYVTTILLAQMCLSRLKKDNKKGVNSKTNTDLLKMYFLYGVSQDDVNIINKTFAERDLPTDQSQGGEIIGG